MAYRNERVFAAAYEVTRRAREGHLAQRKETYAATVVVIVTVAIASIILWSFDTVWGSLANLVLR